LLFSIGVVGQNPGPAGGVEYFGQVVHAFGGVNTALWIEGHVDILAVIKFGNRVAHQFSCLQDIYKAD
jgi:hypothetical protein